MDEAQAWEALYGRRSPEVRVIGRDIIAPRPEDRRDGTRRGYVAQDGEQQPPGSEANAA
jgi:hypothetical protein